MDPLRTKTAHQQRVEDFMDKAKQAVPDRPTLPDEKIRRLRARLILEEALETIHALGFDVRNGQQDHDGSPAVWKPKELIEQLTPNSYADFKLELEEIADGCADILVVTTGTLSACGIADDPVQREVDYNNLAKFQHICQHCRVENSEPNDKEGIPHERRCMTCGATWVGGHHNEAGKWVKPSNHQPPRVAEVLAGQTKAAEAAEAKTVKMKAAEDPAQDPSCFGEEYLPSDKRCQECLKLRRERCIEKFISVPEKIEVRED